MNKPGKYEFDAILHEDPDSGGAYVIFPSSDRHEYAGGEGL